MALWCGTAARRIYAPMRHRHAQDIHDQLHGAGDPTRALWRSQSTGYSCGRALCSTRDQRPPPDATTRRHTSRIGLTRHVTHGAGPAGASEWLDDVPLGTHVPSHTWCHSLLRMPRTMQGRVRSTPLRAGCACASRVRGPGAQAWGGARELFAVARSTGAEAGWWDTTLLSCTWSRPFAAQLGTRSSGPRVGHAGPGDAAACRAGGEAAGITPHQPARPPLPARSSRSCKS